MKVSAQYAKEHIADLLQMASGGVDIEIAVPDKALLKLVYAGPPPQERPAGQAQISGLTLISKDAEIGLYDVSILW